MPNKQRDDPDQGMGDGDNIREVRDPDLCHAVWEVWIQTYDKWCAAKEDLESLKGIYLLPRPLG